MCVYFSFFFLNFFKKQIQKHKYQRILIKRWTILTCIDGVKLYSVKPVCGASSALFFVYQELGICINWYSTLEFTIFWLSLYFTSSFLTNHNLPFRLWVQETNTMSLAPGGGSLKYYELITSALVMYLYTIKVTSIFLTFHSVSCFKHFFNRTFYFYYSTSYNLDLKKWSDSYEIYLSVQTTWDSFIYYLSLERSYGFFLAELDEKFKKSRLLYFLMNQRRFKNDNDLLLSKPGKSSYLLFVLFLGLSTNTRDF